MEGERGKVGRSWRRGKREVGEVETRREVHRGREEVTQRFLRERESKSERHTSRVVLGGESVKRSRGVVLRKKDASRVEPISSRANAEKERCDSLKADRCKKGGAVKA